MARSQQRADSNSLSSRRSSARDSHVSVALNRSLAKWGAKPRLGPPVPPRSRSKTPPKPRKVSLSSLAAMVVASNRLAPHAQRVETMPLDAPVRGLDLIASLESRQGPGPSGGRWDHLNDSTAGAGDAFSETQVMSVHGGHSSPTFSVCDAGSVFEAEEGLQLGGGKADLCRVSIGKRF